MIYIIRMSFLINGKLQFVEISSLGYSTQDKAFEAMKRHQETLSAYYLHIAK